MISLKIVFLQTGIRACVAGGKLVVVGLGGETATLPIASAACKEIDIVGSFRYCNTVSSRSFKSFMHADAVQEVLPLIVSLQMIVSI